MWLFLLVWALARTGVESDKDCAAGDTEAARDGAALAACAAAGTRAKAITAESNILETVMSKVPC